MNNKINQITILISQIQNAHNSELTVAQEWMLDHVKDDDLKKTVRITDRKSAIQTACLMAKPGDIILIAGKGHENYQDVNGVKHHFDDKEIVSGFLG